MHVTWRPILRFGDNKRLAEAPKEASRCRVAGGPVLMTTTTTDDGAAAVATSSPPNGQGRMPLALRPTPSAVPAAPEEDVDRRPRRSSSVAATDCVTEPRLQQPRPPLLMDVAIRCTVPSCSCDCFSPCKSQIRICDSCNHGWVSHALDKLGFRHFFNCHQIELVQPSIAFDVASLMLYGTQAVPVRLKILLDRLFSVLRRDEVLQVLHGFGWTNDDYARGYILRDPTGHVLDRWSMASAEEEPFILQQFLRFGETKTIAQQLLLQEKSEGSEFFASTFFRKSESDIKKLMDRSVKSTSNATPVCSCTVSMTKLTNCHSMYSMASTVTLPLVSKIPFRQPTSSVSSTRSLSPNALSPVNNCASPVSSLSPLNRLQNMQPYDYRREKCSPEMQRTSDTIPPATSSTVLTSTAVSYSSPLSSPATSSLAISTSSATSLNPRIHNFHNNNNNNSDYSGPDDDDDLDDMDDSSSNAINLSSSATPSTSYLDSIFAARKVRHLRKSANPMKRRWNPMVLSTLATNPATGKKRVQCNVCLKTFCDKGALKIHFSAVHLREMHKCTVDGCNMMFSSRRSRNRHSANPNPKLHTPNYRRKINPHDGRAANPYPIIPSSGLSGFSSSPFLPNSLTNHFEGDSNTMTEMDPEKNPDYSYPRKHDECDEEEDLEVNRDTEPTNLSLHVRNSENDLPLQLTKKRCLDDMRVQHDVQEKPISNGNAENAEDGGIDLSMKEAHRVSSSSSAKGVRKRKSLNPTKCPVNSDDELQYVTTDDSSSDTYIDHDIDENGLNDSKSDDLTSDGLDSKDDDDDTDGKKASGGEPSSCSSPTSHCSTPVRISQTTTYSTINAPSNIPKPFHNEKQNGYSILNSAIEIDLLRKEAANDRLRESQDISENPLRHLESLSLGAFANMMSGSQRSHNNRVTHGPSSGVSYHAPGLGLGSTSINTIETTRPESPQPIHDDRISQYLNHGRPLLSPPSSQHVGTINSDPENSLSDQQLPLHPVYRDASSIGSLEIPVDKENPRRCTACGKIFQNHFGVKTHYQNVHLKLMHKCTVEGCNAAFPSKRSRDRHSANLNLHRKLLSTSSEKPQTSFFDKSATGLYPYHPDTIRSDFFSRLYDPQTHLPLNFAELYHTRLSAAETGGFLPGSQYPAHLIPGFHPAFMMPQATSALAPRRHSENGGNGESGRDSPVSSIISSPTTLSPRPAEPGVSSPERKPSIKLEGDLKPDAGGRYSCDICEKKFHESVVLREHYEKCHSNLLVKCVEDGCDKVFLSGRTRNLHSDEVHHRENIPTAS